MEPATHLLTGACLARTGLNRRAAYATAAMVIAAEFPDIDTLWGLRGPVSGFQHHRGITHTFVGIPFEAGLLLLGFYAYHRWRVSRSPPTRPYAPGQAPAPARWGVLYLCLLLALLSHLLLDFTNNYGIRPFFPFQDRWYAGSIVFIFDPLIFVLLLAGLVLPALFGLIGREIGARKQRFRGRGWAWAALLGIGLLWAVRWVQHSRAVVLAQTQTLRAPGTINPAGASPASAVLPNGSTAATAPDEIRPLLVADRSLASPDPLSIFRWYTATDFGPALQLGVVNSRLGTLVPGAIYVKPPPSPGLFSAERSLLGRIYLDWSPMPILTTTAGAPEGSEASGQGSEDFTVTFTDPRFLGGTPLLQRGTRPPLSGEVVLAPGDTVLDQGIDGRFGR